MPPRWWGLASAEDCIGKRCHQFDNCGYIPHVDHSVPPDIPLDNFRYYLERKRLLLEG
jgi:hypothetical protein